MSSETLRPDGNDRGVAGAVTDDSNAFIKMLRIDDTTKGLKVLLVGGAGSGTVTEVDTGTGLTGGPITTTGTISLDSKLAPLDTLGTALQQIRVNAGATALEYFTPSAGSGTVTSVSVVTANGVSGSVATATTTPAITLTLGAITPTTVNGNTITTGTGTLTLGASKTLTVSNTITLAGTDGKGINIGAVTSGNFLIGDGSNMVLSTSTIPTSAGATANKVLLSDGTNYVLSTPTFPNASATSGKIIKSDGTNWTASTETYAAPGTSGNVMTSDGTNWTSATSTSGGSFVLSTGLLGTVGSTSTLYIPISFGFQSATESNCQVSMPNGGTLSNFYFNTTTSQPGTGTLVVTVRKNGADTAVTATVSAGAGAGVFSDTSHSFSYVAGDKLNIKVVNNASGNSASINYFSSKVVGS